MRPMLVLVVMMAAKAVTADSTIPLTNPGFEHGENMPDGWRPVSHGQGFVLRRDTRQAHSGMASACLIGEPGHGSRACFLQTSASFETGEGVRLRLFYKGQGRASGILRFRLAPGFKARHGEYATRSFQCPLPKQEWTEFAFETAVPPGAREAGRARLELILYQRGTGTLNYDDVSLESLERFVPRLQPNPDATACPLRPTDGSRVQQNPPDFWWPPENDAARYDWELSRKPDFPAADTTRVEDLRYNVYSHHAVLEPGTWHWRRRCRTASGMASAWSDPAKFSVAENATPFPVPGPDDLLARVPAGHPRIYATPKILKRFRAPLRDSRREWWETTRSRLDELAERPVDAEPPASYVYGQRDGPLTDEVIRTGQKLRAYCAGVTSRMMQLAFGYMLSADEDYAGAAIRQMTEMATWDPQGITSYRNHDQVFRNITWKMAVAYDWCWDVMTDEQRQSVRQAVLTRARVLYRDFTEDSRPITEYPFNSHGMTAYGFLGICAVALAHEAPEADEWFRFVVATYPALFPPWGGEEGGWCQGTSYWKWSQPFAWWFFDALKSATGLDLYQKAFCRNNGWFKLYCHPPYCDRHHFGDGNRGAPGLTDQSNMAHMAKVYRNPYFQWYAKRIPGWPSPPVFSYWWYERDLPAKPPVDLPQGRYFSDIGWVAMHSDLSDPDNVMLAFKSSWFGSFNHSHADQNHFVLYAYGEPLLIDSGYYDWYSSPHDRGWTRQTKAHNAILVNGEGQPIFDITAKGEILEHITTPFMDYACGDATQAYDGRLEHWHRHILFLRPETFLIYDELMAPEPASFTWCLHAENRMTIDPARGCVTVTRGKAGCRVQFLEPGDLTITQDDDFTPPSTRDYPKQWHAYATNGRPQKQITFVTLIQPYRMENRREPPPVNWERQEQGGKLRIGNAGDDDMRIQVVTQGDRRPRFESWWQMGSRRLTGTVYGNRLSAEPGGPTLAWLPGDTIASAEVTDDPVPAICALDGRAGQDGELRLHSGETHGILKVNAQAVDPLGNASVRRVPVAAGQSIVYGVDRANPEPTIEVRLDDEPIPLTPRAWRQPTGGLLQCGQLSVNAALMQVVATSPVGARWRIGAAKAEIGCIVPGRGTMTVEVRTGQGNTAQPRLLLSRVHISADVAEAVYTEPDLPTPDGTVMIEAESAGDHGGGNVRVYTHRTFLSGGAGLEMQVVMGAWVSWTIHAPRTGDYHIMLKGAAHMEYADRLIQVDGKPAGDDDVVHRFPNTGGFGATPEQWRYMMLARPDGTPLEISLTAGEHRLRMISLDKKLNLDCLLLVPVTP